MALLEDPLPLEDRQQSVATNTWRIMEFLGCLWATFIAAQIAWVLLVFPGLLHVFVPQLKRLGENWEQVIRWTLVTLCLLLNGPLLFRLWRSFLQRDSHEISLYAAALQPLWPPILRPLVALWWLGHFALAIRIGLFFEDSFPIDPHVGFVAFVMVLFFAAYASNIFLMHAVTALTRGPAVQRVWNWRAMCDLGIVAAGVFWKLFAQHGSPHPPY